MASRSKRKLKYLKDTQDEQKEVYNTIAKIDSNVGRLTPFLSDDNRPQIVTSLLGDAHVQPLEYSTIFEEIYKDKMYTERLFIDEQLRDLYLIKDPLKTFNNSGKTKLWTTGLRSTMTNTSTDIRKLALKSLERLNVFYILMTESAFWGHIQENIKRKTVKQKMSLSELHFEDVSSRLLDLWKVFEMKRYKTVVFNAKLLLRETAKWSPATKFGNKFFLQGDILHLLGLALIELGEFKEALEYYEVNSKISDISGNVASKMRHVDSLGRLHAIGGSHNEAILWYSVRSKYVNEIEETIWVDYQMGLCYFHTRAYNKAFEKLVSCIANAKKCHSLPWEFNACLLKGCVHECLFILLQVSINITNEVHVGLSISVGCQHLEQALRIATKMNHIARINITLNLIREVFKILEKEFSDRSCRNPGYARREPASAFFSPSLYSLLTEDMENRNRESSAMLRKYLLFPTCK